MDDLGRLLGVTPTEGVAVVISTVVMYTVFTVVMYLWGHHLRTSESSFTIAVAALMGGIAARVTLGHTPTLAAGLIALGTLFIMEKLFGTLRATARTSPRSHPHDRRRHGRPDRHTDPTGGTS